MTEAIIIFIAGLFTVLSPCVLPALPLIIGSASQRHRLGPLALAAGMVCSFSVVGTIIAASGSLFGLSPHLIRMLSAAVLLLFGLVMLSKRLQDLLARILTPLSTRADRVLQGIEGTNFRGQFAVGALLGAIWSPCSGPSLGTALALAAQHAVFQAFALMMIFSVGAATPLLLIAYGSRAAFIRRRSAIAGAAEKGKVIFGVILVIVSIAILTGADKQVEIWFLQVAPEWITDLTTEW